MSVTVKIDNNAVVARIAAANEKALLTLKGQILSNCNEFCPEDQGTLIKSSETHSHVMSYFGETELRLVWSTPYARALYYGVVMVDPLTGKACFPVPDGHGGTRLVSRCGVGKVMSSPKRYYKFKKAHGSSTPCKMWCEKARETYNDDWRLIYQNALKGAL